MNTSSADHGEGTSNADRISSEVKRAAIELIEHFPGYRERVADAALECYLLTAEHDEQRISINQRFDQQIMSIAQKLSVSRSKEEAL